MARKDRVGNRIPRKKRRPFKVPNLGYYLIITDTEATERCFFEGLKKFIPDSLKRNLVIKVIETKTQNMIDKCRELASNDAQYRLPWIVFDRDQVQNFDEIIADAENQCINVGWSNPCFEIWMFAYFGNMPTIEESWNCCSEFGKIYKAKTGQQYNKSDENLYNNICNYGNEEQAIKIADDKLKQQRENGKNKPSIMCPSTTVYRLIYEIKVKCKGEG